MNMADAYRALGDPVSVQAMFGSRIQVARMKNLKLPLLQ